MAGPIRTSPACWGVIPPAPCLLSERCSDLVMMLASDRCANVMGAGVTLAAGMVPTL